MTNTFELFELAQFIETRLKPAAVKFEAASGDDDLFARGELHEAIWWLHFGVELGCFPGKESALICAQYHQLLGRNYEAFVKFENWRFPPRLNAWTEAALSLSDAFPVLDHFGKPASLLPQFQASLAISEQFVEDEAAQAFLRLQLFSNDETWKNLLAQTPSYEQIHAALKTGDLGPTHDEIARLAYSFWEKRGQIYWDAEDDWFRAERQLSGKRDLVSGFLRTQEHMDTSAQFFDDFQGWSPATSSDRGKFAQRVGEIQVWRLNLWNTVVQKRFEEIAWKARDIIAMELKELGADAKEADAYHQTTLTLMHTWKQNHRPAQLAVASA